MNHTPRTYSPIKAKAKAERIRALLEQFPFLPETALVPMDVLRALTGGRGVTSIRRDIAAGRLCQPIHIGPNCSRWPVSAIRQYLAGL